MFCKLVVSLLLACQLCSANIMDLPEDIPWTQAINKELCKPGAHTDAVAQKFFACYDESIVPGGQQFVRCMDIVYGVRMNSEKGIDTVCAASSKFPLYAGCILKRLPLFAHVLPSNAIHKLNECQGGVLGVAPPA